MVISNTQRKGYRLALTFNLMSIKIKIVTLQKMVMIDRSQLIKQIRKKSVRNTDATIAAAF